MLSARQEIALGVGMKNPVRWRVQEWQRVHHW
nr:MAG TPA: hypothetical protein [Bacteriophage sp.]